ncbi:MAG TPA: NlpC/P60 family protein [Gemmatimonadaceae bacterium]|jgi:cell wall-associated NlpC family hydrolase|nr:NlpC/P60 family protein [Gemmatimonadaceae bacterium]
MSGSPSTHAIVRAAVAPMHAEARVSSPQVSQRLGGHLVEILEVRDEWRRVRGADGYEGWIHAGYLTPAPPPGARQSAGLQRISLGCVAGNPAGGHRALPLGAFLAPEEVVQAGEAIDATEQPHRFPRDVVAIARSAQALFEGTSYQWGGVTPWGADCSGFVQSVFWLHGVMLPRDAYQQADASAECHHGLAEIEPAELAFFSDRPDGAITHVGVGLGGGRLAHVAVGRGGFAIERLANKGDGYVARLHERFLFNRRVL